MLKFFDNYPQGLFALRKFWERKTFFAVFVPICRKLFFAPCRQIFAHIPRSILRRESAPFFSHSFHKLVFFSPQLRATAPDSCGLLKRRRGLPTENPPQ